MFFLCVWLFFFFFREELGEKEKEKHRCERNIDRLVASHTCPDRESNLQPFGVWDDTPTN